MSWTDLAALALAALAAFGPGAVLVRVGLHRGWLETFAVGPPVSVAICYLTSLLVAGLGLPWNTLTVAATTLVLAGGCWFLRRRRGVPNRTAAPVARIAVWLPAAGMLTSSVIGAVTFMRGFGDLSVLPQEHDMVLQTVVAARIERTGEAAPWQSSPVDLLTGDPEGFYPNGVHMLASLAATEPADTVTALNAMTVILFALVLPIGMVALAGLLAPRAIRPVAMAVAPLVSVVAYRPVFSFLHDGGVLANGAAFALTPAAVYAAVACVGARRTGAYASAAAGFIGAVVTHPTAAPTIAITAGCWIAAIVVLRSTSARGALAAVGPLAAALAAAVVVLVPFLFAASTTANFVSTFPRGTPETPLGRAFGTTLSFTYGGFFDTSDALAQTVLAVLSLVGLAMCLYHRTNLPLVATYAVWLGILILWLLKPDFPIVTTLGSIYYNAFNRLSTGLTMVQWLTVAAAVGYMAVHARLALRRVARRIGTGRTAAGRWVSVAAAGGAVLAFVAAVIPYAEVNSVTLQERYRNPEFVRVGDDDLAAGRYLAEHVRPGERVMNSANDGSTYSYVFYGVPLVGTTTLGSPWAPYSTDLLMSFDDLERDAEVRELVCDLEIAWVVADEEAPLIGAPAAVTPLGEDNLFSTPPGFRDLEELATIDEAFTQGTVTVYEVDLAELCG